MAPFLRNIATTQLGVGPYYIIGFGPAGSIFYREYGLKSIFDGVIFYDTDKLRA